MSPEQKEKALLKYFVSEAYIREFHKNYEAFWEYLIAAISVFEADLPEDYDGWENKEKIDIWKERVLIRYRSKKTFEEAINQHLDGDSDSLWGITNSYPVLMTRIWDLVVTKWLSYIDPSYKENWIKSFDKGAIQASNIFKTLDNSWKSGSILKETVTGPINESDL